MILMMLFLGACMAPRNNPPDLIGKTVEYQYGEYIYHVQFLSDSTLHWEAVTGGEKGVTGDETYVSEWISSSQLFITWKEVNDVGVSQVLDFQEGTVSNHLLHGRNASKGKGTIKIID